MTMSSPSILSPRPLAGLLAAAVIAVCAGCATAAPAGAPTRTISDGQSFSMRPGDDVALPDASRLHYAKVVADSRCPADVQCVWAGDAELEFTRTTANRTAERFTLHTGRGERSHDFDGRRLTLVSLAPGASPQAELQIDAATANTP